jgi:hypothetical protein
MALVQIPTPVVSADKTIAQIASGTWTSGGSLSFTSLTNYDKLIFRLSGVTTGSAYSLSATINNNTSSVYDHTFTGGASNGSDWSLFFQNNYQTGNTEINLSTTTAFATNAANSLFLQLDNCKSTGFTTYEWVRIFRNFASTAYYATSVGRGIFKSSAGVSSLEIISSAIPSAGDYVLWGG